MKFFISCVIIKIKTISYPVLLSYGAKRNSTLIEWIDWNGLCTAKDRR